MAPQVFFINLDRVPARADFIVKQSMQAGIPSPVRVSAIDAQQNDMQKVTRYRPRSWGPYWQLSDTEIAVFESHRSIWSRIALQDNPAVILEDDVLLSQSLGPALAMLEGYKDFDFIKLDAAPPPARLGPQRELNGLVLRPILQTLPSAAAYLLSPRGARNLLERSKRYCDHVDDLLTRPWRGYRAYQLCPALSIQGMFSEIEHGRDIPADVAGSERTASDPQTNSLTRGPAAYRVWKELGRAVRKARQKLGGDALLRAKGGTFEPVPLASDLPPYRRRS